MKKTYVILAIFAAIVIGAAIAWNILFPSGTWRYKITVNIETPEGLKSGSAVREIHAVAPPPYAPPDVKTSIDIKGEAVVIDLGKKGKLFALVDTDDWHILTITFPNQSGLTSKGIRYYNSLGKVSAKVPLEAYPRIVAFKDINDPKTIFEPYKVILNTKGSFLKRGRAEGVEDHLETAFGKGVKLKDVTLEITDEPITWNISEVIPWLPNFYNKLLDGSNTIYYKSPYPVANSISAGNFLAKGNER